MPRLLKEGIDVGITPDGPRGPRYRVQPGVIALARLIHTGGECGHHGLSEVLGSAFEAPRAQPAGCAARGAAKPKPILKPVGNQINIPNII